MRAAPKRVRARASLWGNSSPRSPQPRRALVLNRTLKLSASDPSALGACAADLSVELDAPSTTVAVGDGIKYPATVTNAGPLAAENVDLDVRAPDGNPFDTAASLTGHSSCTPVGSVRDVLVRQHPGG